MPYTSMTDFVAYDVLDAADLNVMIDNLDYLNGKINSEIQLWSFKSTATTGASPNSFETTTNDVNFGTMDFADGATVYHAQAVHVMPSDYNGGTVTAKFIWDCGNASTNSVVWQIRARCWTDSDALDQAFGTAQIVTDANNANLDLNISASTPAITIAGTPAAGKVVVWDIYRDPAHASDNLAATAQLLGVIITYTRS
jgi:Tfp pilus assembly protein PilX